jgi:2,4-dienoyl-CoA reductase-like NADH-dependent reductase (Old Yellow Enzyme family)
MSTNTGRLFTPFNVKSLSLRNRVVMAPMTRTFSPGYVPTEDVAAYYERRAKAGVGLIITEGTTVPHKAANGYERVPAFHGEKALAGWKLVVDRVHAAGGQIIPQLWHVGAIRKAGVGPDKDVPGYSPSGLYKPGKASGVAMSKEDITDVVNAFRDAAVSAKSLGFDGVEVHGAHGYLVDQFFWEGTNQRTDEYGGTIANRSRFACEIVRAIRAATGDDFAIVFRFSQWKQQDYDAKLAQNPEELKQFLQPLVDAGVDVFHCSTRRFWEPEFENSNLNLAGWTKELTGKPAMTVGSVGLDGDFVGEGNFDMTSAANPAGIENLTERMEKGEFDLVAVGRALLVDPEWLAKIRHGALSDIKPYTKDALMSLS